MINIQEIKEHYKDAHVEDFGDYEIVSVDKKDLEWLIEQAEKKESLEKQLNAKIMFVNNGMEEEKYS